MLRESSESGFHFIQAYIRCQRQFYHTVIDKLGLTRMAPPLVFGTAIHEGLAEYYKDFPKFIWTIRLGRAKVKFAQAMAEMKGEYEDFSKYEGDLQKGHDLLADYAAKYGAIDQNWFAEIEGIEEQLETKILPTSDVFTGRIDLRYINQDGRRYIMDHKTTNWFLDKLIKTLSVSDQATGYIWLWNKKHPDAPVDGLVYNVLGNKEFVRHLVSRSELQLQEFERKAAIVLDEIARKVNSPVENWIKNTDNCYLYNRQCDYYDLCFLGGLKEALYKPLT